VCTCSGSVERLISEEVGGEGKLKLVSNSLKIFECTGISFKKKNTGVKRMKPLKCLQWGH